MNSGAYPALVNSDGDTPYDIADDEEIQKLLQDAINSQGNHQLGSHDHTVHMHVHNYVHTYIHYVVFMYLCMYLD